MKTKPVELNYAKKKIPVNLPDQTDILKMESSKPLSDPEGAIQKALDYPINSPGLNKLIRDKQREKKSLKAVVVISDNTRPVPYKGEKGILWPIIERLLEERIAREDILVLVATGTHRSLSRKELEEILDPRVFQENIRVKNHNCRDDNKLTCLGKSSRGSSIYVDSDYLQADIKILTGLVESHFMAGVSGGRKAVCPGLAGEKSTYIFHGAEMLASPKARDLILEGNPCHEESLEIAKLAGVDFIVNVTLDFDFNLTGVFAGELDKAHQQAFQRIKEYVAIPVEKEYDIVISHGGFVGLNHYQVAKVGVVSIPLLKPNGKLVIVSDLTDDDPIGSQKYKTTLHLLKLFGAERFKKLIFSPDWVFVPDQWQVQMWTRLFSKIPQENFIFYSHRLTAEHYQIIPGRDGNIYLEPSKRYQEEDLLVQEVIENVVSKISKESGRDEDEIRVAFLADGPYGIPLKE